MGSLAEMTAPICATAATTTTIAWTTTGTGNSSTPGTESTRSSIRVRYLRRRVGNVEAGTDVIT